MPRDDLWDRYWTHERRSSIEAFPEAARDAIELRWQTFFGRLGSGARILDIGCGAGALAAVAARTASAARPLVYIGADRTEVLPAAPGFPI